MTVASATDVPTPALSYATPSAAGGSPTAAGVWLTLAGLALVFFGGCFCIGILLLTTNAFYSGFNSPGFRPLTGEQQVLMLVLYGCAAACFAAGVWVGWLGVRKLLAMGR